MLQKSTLLILISLLFSGMLSAQICTPDTSFTTPGIYPSNLPDGCLNQTYDDVITVVVPQDTTVNIPPFGNTTVPIDSIVLVNVKNLQTGLSYACGNPSCGFAGNTSGCILIHSVLCTLYNIMRSCMEHFMDMTSIKLNKVVDLKKNSISKNTIVHDYCKIFGIHTQYSGYTITSRKC